MTADADTAVTNAYKALQAARHALAGEILGYPTPISGCDAQFNYLLALRDKISRALDELEAEVFVPTPRSPTQFTGVESR